MYNYVDIDRFPDVRNVDTTDVVLGGPGGAANKPLQDLADRTFWLKKRMGNFLGVKTEGADFLIDISYINNLVYISAGGLNGYFSTDPVLGDFPVGARIFFHVSKPGLKEPLTLHPTGGQDITLYDGEQIELTRLAGYWLITHQQGNFDIVGEDAFVRRVPSNAVIANGVVLNRGQFVRLWNIVKFNAIPEWLWLSDPVFWKATFGQGDGATTFRIPDLRSLYSRALDLGRGLSIWAYGDPGGYQADAIVDHHHHLTMNNNSDSTPGAGKVAVGGQNPEGNPPEFDTGGPLNSGGSAIGATETRVKSYGKIPIIYF